MDAFTTVPIGRSARVAFLDVSGIDTTSTGMSSDGHEYQGCVSQSFGRYCLNEPLPWTLKSKFVVLRLADFVFQPILQVCFPCLWCTAITVLSMVLAVGMLLIQSYSSRKTFTTVPSGQSFRV